jgi:acyl carrier protein
MAKSTDSEPFREDILEFLEQKRGIDPTLVTDDSRLAEDLGLDSLALVEMGFALLTRHGLMLDDDHILRMRTFGDLLDVLGEEHARSHHGPR